MSPFVRLFAVMTKPFTVVVYVGLVILSFFYFDRPLAYYFHDLDLRTNLSVLSLITNLGLGIFYLPTFFLLALFFRYIQVDREWEVRSWFLFMCVVIPGVICLFLKAILGRARPSLLLNEGLYGFYGVKTNAYFWSLPSGHTTTIIGAALGLSIVFPRYFYTFILIGLTVALSRVLLTQHYLSDVMTAAYLTLIEVGLLLYFLRRKSWLTPVWEHTV